MRIPACSSRSRPSTKLTTLGWLFPAGAGGIRYAGSRFRAISKFALVVLRERNPSRQSCDGWKEVAWNGEKLDLLRCAVLRCATLRCAGALQAVC
jgi:hypothetical protein